MRKLKWRVLSLILAVAMVLTSVPMTAKAEEEEPYDGMEVTVSLGEGMPESIPGFVWVAGRKSECDALLHSHTDDCYVLDCDHKNGHSSTCFGESVEETVYSKCTHDNDNEHTGSVTIADVVEYEITYKSILGQQIPLGIEIVWKEHAATDVVKKEFEDLGGNGNLVQKISAITKIYDTKFCFTTTSEVGGAECEHAKLYGETGHSAIDDENSCYRFKSLLEGGCSGRSHEHSIACQYEKYTLYADVNGNGTPDKDDPSYTVEYVNEGETLQTDTVLVGMPYPEYEGATPTKAGNAQYTYSFSGWTNAEKIADTVTEDVTHVAQFSETTNTYTVEWEVNGTVVETDKEVPYGTKVSYDGEMPTKEEEGKLYTFSGWNPEVTEETVVTGDMKFVAQFSDKDIFTVVYNIEGASTTKYVVEGEKAEAYAPTRENYSLDGWYTDSSYETKYDFETTVSDAMELYARWIPTEDVNNDGIYDGDQKNTIHIVGTDERVLVNNEVVTLENGEAIITAYVSSNNTLVVTPADGKYLTGVTLDGEEKEFTPASATITLTVGASQTYKVVISSTAKKATTVNVKANPTVDYFGEEITAEEVLEKVFESVTTADNTVVTTEAADVEVVENKVPVIGTKYTISKKAGSLWIPNGTTIGGGLLDFAGVEGTYKITVYYVGDDIHKESAKVDIEFTLVDGRAESTLELKDNSVAINDLTDIPVTETEIIEALFVQALADEKVIVDPELSVSSIYKYNETTADYTTLVYSKTLNLGSTDLSEFGQYQVEIDMAESNKYSNASEKAILTVVDNRVSTTITLNEGVSVTYSADMTEEDIYNAVFASITAEDGSEVLPVFGENMSVEIDNMNAGTHTVTVKFAGNNTQAASSAECELVIEKANTTVSVESKTVKYQDIKDSGVNVSGLISASPEASMIKYAVGLKLGDNASADAGAIAYVSIPSLIDMDSIPSTIRPYVEPIINAALGSLENGATMTVSQLKSLLEGVLKGLESVEGFVPVGIDTTAINALVSALQAIEGMEGVGSLTVKLLVGNDIVVKDSGMYVTGGVVTDANYNTAVNMGYLVITPDGTKVELAFNVEDANGIITRGAILSGEYDLGSHVVEDGISEEVHAGATEHLVNVYIGVDAEGNTVMSDTPSADIGAYTQIAYIRDLGNEMYYAEPIVRSYVVVADTAIVEFIDENGNVNDERVFTFDGTPKSMTARATDRNGNPLPSENISYKYIGIEGDAEGYYGSEAPTEAGVYTVIATYIDAEQTHVGMAIGAMIIQPADSSIEVADKVVTYDGNPVDVLGMITKTPEDAKMAVIMAGLDVSGDFSENGLSAVKGVVNIDFPARVDEILAQYVPSAYADGITIDSFINKIDEINTALAEQGMESEYLNEIKDILAQMPNATTLTFKEQSEVNPTSIGAYLVQAVIFDPNYKPEADTGILVIAPEVKEVVLDWNYTDVNGIITRPILDEVDLGATAFNSADSTKNDEYTGKVKYLFVGVDTEGNQVMTDDASTLPNGAYTQIAYVPAEDVSASMTLVAPIMRSFVIAPQGANVDFVDVNGNDARLFTYDGTPKAMEVEVTDMAGVAIPQELLDKYLTVTYVGVDVEGGYNSTTPPTEIGAYTVTAVYAEYDENGELVRAGMDVGAMVIEPKENGFGVDDTTVPYDGKEHLEEAIVNANDLEYITIITDEENNVNVILPESWGVETTELKLKEGIAAVIKELDKLPEEVKNESAIKAIYNALNKLDEIKSLTLNGVKPVEVGVYNVVGISYGENYKVAVDAGVLTIAQRELNIVIDDKEKVYGDKDPEFTYTVNGIVAGEEVKVDIELVREEGEDVGEYVITIADEATPAATTEEGKSVISNPNYKMGTVTNGTLTINPIEVVITPDALQKYVGETDPAITFKAEGILKDDDVTITVLRADGETAGVYEYVNYVADGEDAGNYTFTLDTTNKFTILEKDNTGEGDKPGDNGQPGGDNKPNDGGSSDDKTSADETSKDKVVESGKTGDNANIGLYLGLALAAMAAIVAVLFSRKRSR